LAKGRLSSAIASFANPDAMCRTFF
jgi:hypothetical protein